MKPEGWDRMTDEEKERIAVALLSGMRGQYIIGQALRIAVETMSKAAYPETSNIQDMEMMGETLFQIGWHTAGLPKIDPSKSLKVEKGK
jgi:hypothetical protein